MKPLLFIILIGLSLPIKPVEPRYTVYLDNPITEVKKELVEAPVEVVMEGAGEGVDEEELHCLALALYKESRGEPERGSILVAQVIMNRRESKKFSNSVCSVVKRKLAGNCMFSFWCEPHRERITDIKSYKRLTGIAYNAILGRYKGVTTSTYFKVCRVESGFFNKLKYKGREANHCFYEEYNS